MKKLSFIFVPAIFLANLAFADGSDKVVATYKGGEVKESEVVQQFKPMLAAQLGENKTFNDLPPEMQETLVRAFVNMSLLKQEVEKSNITSSKEFKEKLENVRMQLAQQELVENYVNEHVTEKMINAEYDKLVSSLKGKNEIKVSHILVETEKKALDIKNKLSKGQKFSELAKESKDEASKNNGGDIGYVIAGQLVPEFEEAAFALKVNDVSAPVKTKYGWHIIKVLDKRLVKVNEKEAKASIAENLKREAAQQYFMDLASKADVKILLSAQGETQPAEPAAKN